MRPWDKDIQSKNRYWVLPRPKPDHYKGGMPLYAEEWLIGLAKDIVGVEDPTILNLFCGMNKLGYRVDLNQEVEPDLLCDAHKLTQYIEGGKLFDIVLADPPYSDEECVKLYGAHYPKLNYKKWTSEAEKVLKVGGLLIVYDKYRKPNPNPQIFRVVQRVAVENRTNHVLRCAVFFRKVNGGIEHG